MEKYLYLVSYYIVHVVQLCCNENIPKANKKIYYISKLSTTLNGLSTILCFKI